GAMDFGALAVSLGITLAKVAGFVVLMLIVGRRAIPMLLHYIAHTGSRELFRLAVLSVALGVAFIASELFGVSFALGAFFAGMTLSESELSQVAAEESLPLRLRRRRAPAIAPVESPAEAPLLPTRLRDHAILIGYGRVGRLVGRGLAEKGWPLLVIEDAQDAFEQAKAAPLEAIHGNAAD